MVFYRNSTTIIFDSNRIISVNCNINIITIAGQCFINRIINNFINQMMKTLYGC